MKTFAWCAVMLVVGGCASPSHPSQVTLAVTPSPSASVSMRHTSTAHEVACAPRKTDARSIASRDGKTVVFVQTDARRNDSTGAGDTPHTDLCIARGGGVPHVLVAGRGSPEDTNMRDVLADFDEFLFSPDESTLYFTSAAWATSRAAHAVDLRTGEQRFLVDGAIQRTIEHGPFEGKLLAAHFRLDDAHPVDSPLYRGRIEVWSIIDSASGNTTRKLPEDEAARESILAGRSK